MVQVVSPPRLRAASLLAVLVLGAAVAPAPAQTIDDGIMMPKKNLFTGFLYTHDSWEKYWEGSLKRINGNIGTVTTQTLAWSGNYGITDRLNIFAIVPYVKTEASQGVLHGLKGFQDLTVAAKYNLLETDFTSHGILRTVVVAQAGLPLTDYTPDFLPMSIGSHSKTFSGRLTLMFMAKKGWFINGSGAYTWRGKVTLDRPAYFTEDQLFLSDEVAMPDVFSYVVSAGYMKPRLLIPITFSQQITRGGGDIRRQDAPFVSNRMNYQRVEALAMVHLPTPKDLAVRVAGTYAVNGRNVGQATTFTAGLLYTFHF